MAGEAYFKRSCISRLERLKYDIDKNFRQMDLENADIKEEINQIIEEMLSVIETEINRVSTISFNSIS